MKYLVAEPDGTAHELFLPKNALGQECLDKVCEKLGIKERDYFGLRHTVGDTKSWVKLRNPMVTQMRLHLPGKPHRLQLEVKFFVSPQEIQQPQTRHQFYLSSRQNLTERKLNIPASKAVKLCALIAQADYGDYSPRKTTYTGLFEYFPRICATREREIVNEHKKLTGMSSNMAKIKFLNIISKDRMYDCELFKVKVTGEKLVVGVGSKGLTVIERRRHDSDPLSIKEMISFDEISRMTLFEERLIIVVKVAADRYNFVHYFLSSAEAAKAIHKSILEHQLFFHASEIRNSVLDHYLLTTPCWSLPGKWLNKTPACELYHLDVKHTRRHAYDHHFHTLNPDRCCTNQSDEQDRPEFEDDELLHERSSNVCTKCTICKEHDVEVVFNPCGHLFCCADCAPLVSICRVCNTEVTGNQRVYFAVGNFQDDKVCQICMDADVCNTFVSCGHIYCCDECSDKLDYCPLCKKWITFAQRVVFPQENCSSKALMQR